MKWLVLHPSYIEECKDFLEGQTIMGTDGVLRKVIKGEVKEVSKQ